MEETNILYAGIDVGSTTTKIVLMKPETKEILYSDYQRHQAAQIESVIRILKQIEDDYHDDKLCLVFTGSGASTIAQKVKAPFIQEVVANSIAIKEDYGHVSTAIELGGQDAKMIFFNNNTEEMQISDMRMNGSCAGGTGAFLDEMASILNVPVEEFNDLAAKGTCVYDISGRCGVYAKTDVQPLLNQGISKADLALSSMHAVAKQTIGGLAQGLDIEKPVIFEGGPLLFNPTLVEVFKERLELSDDEAIVPQMGERMVAYGAALSLLTMFDDQKEAHYISEYIDMLTKASQEDKDYSNEEKPFFESDEEKEEFLDRHQMKEVIPYKPHPGETVRAYLGIDSGSTTTKFVLMGEDEELLDSFYSNNLGDPIDVCRQALIKIRDRYQAMGAKLQIIACGVTGYGENLFNCAFNAETHVVETVAHNKAAMKYVPDTSFILDIGGQDMKAIWVDNGIISNIVVNEACSSGCGSFLENFASSLHIKVEDIAKVAFTSKHPAKLGSRCTVFMNSSIVTEQRHGKESADIMAGLCRSIIENVFTKVIRISNVSSLGDHIVVQGGTFNNDAVLKAMEDYIGLSVTRAPYPGIMGAIGVALIAKERHEQGNESGQHFIGLDALDSFSYTQESNSICPYCANHCHRTIVRFSNGKSYVTNNRCERGEVLEEPGSKEARARLKTIQKEKNEVPNMFDYREKLLFKMYDIPDLGLHQDQVIGLPRVLNFWELMPFWSTFFRALGFKIKISKPSTRQMYEEGLYAVTSDTVCFPAKLVHGHIHSLAKSGQVDRIFMPSISAMPPENTEKTSESMCAVVKGYPLVMKNSDNPYKKFNVIFDTPMFYWSSDKDRTRQITKYMKETFNIDENICRKAIDAGNRAMDQFHHDLQAAGQKILDDVRKNNTYAVVLASRPYQNDPLVNHDLPSMFTRLKIPVLTVDSLSEINDIDLSKSRLDVVNNFHGRMLSSAIYAASDPHLEYVQIVNFGCGHDAYLSDEIIRLMNEISSKTPLVLKLDESDIQGPLNIRVRSFVETIEMKHNYTKELVTHPLKDPYPVKYEKEDRQLKTVLVPNTSHAFARVMSAAMKNQGLKAEALDIGREEAIALGKKYVHNDICFPAQMCIGEALNALESGKYDVDKVAIGMGKYIGDCRLTHYSALLRKALDDAGYSQVPILTNDDVDYHNMHPGFKMNLRSALGIAFALPMVDIMEELLRKVRPYEIVPGSANAAFEKGIDAIVEGLEKKGASGAVSGFEKAIDIFKEVKYDRSTRRPTVLIVGEYLLNFHPGANHDIEDYLEKNGFEIIEARMSDVIQKSYFSRDCQVKEYHLSKPTKDKINYSVSDMAFDVAHRVANRIGRRHPLYDEDALPLKELAKESDDVIYHTFDAGEGILIPGEIIHHANKGCRNFIILQPFGCLPNHIVGRGVVKKLKEMYPDAQILPLDYDPDVSFANIENRLQMLIMNNKLKEKDEQSSAS